MMTAVQQVLTHCIRRPDVDQTSNGTKANITQLKEYNKESTNSRKAMMLSQFLP